MARVILFFLLIPCCLWSQEKFSVDPYFNCELTQTERDSLNRLIKKYTEIISLDSLNKESFFNRGIVWMALGMHHKAYKDFSDVIKLDTSNAVAHYNRALSRSKYGFNFDSCKDLFQAFNLGLLEAKELYQKKCGLYTKQIENHQRNGK